jgi:hypothetical protein
MTGKSFSSEFVGAMAADLVNFRQLISTNVPNWEAWMFRVADCVHQASPEYVPRLRPPSAGVLRLNCVQKRSIDHDGSLDSETREDVVSSRYHPEFQEAVFAGKPQTAPGNSAPGIVV